jgi:protoporphyrin/coproporphyrin ferrochelatase
LSTQNRQTNSDSLPPTGILIANIGTPAAPTPEAIQAFLAQFLADPFVIDYPRWLWLPILHGIILHVRPRRSARNYQRIWTDAGSPLLFGTQNLAFKLQTTLAAQLETPLHVTVGMRYGQPSITTALQQLREQGCERLLVLPLFPQYSGTTTGTILAAVDAELKTWASPPALTIIRDYHDHSAYIQSLAAQIRLQMVPGMKILFSFHGIPRRYGEVGDPYESQCQRTASLLAVELDLKPEVWSLAYQSRFGPEAWLTPYTDEELIRYGSMGLPLLNTVCPGFAVDCLETLGEIANEGAQTFREAGGGRLNYIPALNDGKAQGEMLSKIILEHL